MTRKEARELFHANKLTQDSICTHCGYRYGTHTIRSYGFNIGDDAVLTCIIFGGGDFTMEPKEKTLYREIDSLLITGSQYLESKCKIM